MMQRVERREDRSAGLDSALGLLLRAHRQRGEFELMVLATTEGLIIASDGPEAECEELAAYAPLLARGQLLSVPPRRVRGVTAHAFLAGRQELILVIRGGADESITSTLALASIKGAMRILRG